MQHYDEVTLDLFVLGCKTIEPLRNAIIFHLAECCGCRELTEEIQKFYKDVDILLKESEHLDKGETVQWDRLKFY